MPDANRPLLSVVVPVYNVGSYLRPCLDSLLGQNVEDVEIICVDDGSTDRSGELAEMYAHKDTRVRVLHVANGGLGRARNIGTEVARGRYLAFVDSDDRVPVDGYEVMCASLERSGSDLATGMVLRFTDTRSWRSGLHTTAMPRGAQATHISKMSTLVSDTTAWNKVFRRTFWDEHEFRFPEGVYYEDIPVTIPAHVLARQVDVVSRIVYEWRERGDGSLSITQRRTERKNLQDRLAAIESASDFLLRYGNDRLVKAHDTRVLTGDIRLYLDVLDVADDDYRHLFMSHVQQYLRHVDSSILRQLPAWERVAYELLLRGRLEETVQLLQTRNAARRTYEVKRRGFNLYARLPYFRDRAVGVPDEAYAVTNSLQVRSGVEEVEIRNGKLVLRGFGMLYGVGLHHPWSALRYVTLRNSKTGRRITRLARPVPRPDLTAENGKADAGYGWAGFEVDFPLHKIPAVGAEGKSAIYEVQLKIVSLGARRGVPLQAFSTARFRRPIEVGGDGTHVALYNWNTLRAAVTRNPVVARCAKVDVEAGVLDCELRLPHRLTADAWMTWRCDGDEAPEVSAALIVDEKDPLLARAGFRLADFQLLGPRRDGRAWQATLDSPSLHPATGEETHDVGRSLERRPVLVDPDFAEQHSELPPDGRELVCRCGPAGRLQLDDRRARVTVEEFSWDDGELLLRLSLPGDLQTVGEDVHISLRHPDGMDVTPHVARRAGSMITARFAVLYPNARSIAPGTWTLQVREGEFVHNRFVGIDVDQRCAEQPDSLTRGKRVTAYVLVGRNRFLVRVRSGRESDRGEFNQEMLRAHFYPRARRRPLQDTVLFMAWSGKQYSCNPRAVYEEMRRQGRDEPMLWVRRDASVDVPDGVPSVLMWSREYYETLATTRHIVANDALPVYFEKRLGTSYLQTWHGTPLKRIGFDIENVQFGNSRYLEEFAVEVTRWDQLISPNRYSTEIFRRAFDYRGAILETGYPRNDVFYAPDVEDRARAVRKRLGLGEHQRVILWAPTWRDDQRDRRGRYELPLPFDLATWDYILGPDDILLFRGHQLVQATVSGKLGQLRSVRNVTNYGDIQDLYLVADLLVTDYSSVMFDFANTRRPMIFYAWDLEVYRDNLRGFYVDFEHEAPGPVVTDIEGLHSAIADPAVGEAAATRYEKFVQRYCGLEDGHAAARVVSAMFGD